MRVTRLIREYVEKKVKENYPKSVAELVWEEHKKSMSDAITEANEKIFEIAQKLAEELNAKYGFSNDSGLKAYDHYNVVSNEYDYQSEIYKAYRKAKDERQKKIDEKIEEILLTLELDGSKADLDEMLANIGR